jgi:VWFA-related protein
MKKTWPILALILLSCASALSQSTKPAPSPTPPDDNEVVKISTNLIQLDVTVTDSKGKPIPDLISSEVEIYENGKKQDITNFSFISNAPTAVPGTVSKGQRDMSVPPPPSTLRRENVKRTIALVVDDLNLSHTDVFFTKEALRRFVNQQMQEGDLVAIVRTGAGIGALQQFTTDRRILLAAIDKLHYNMLSSGRQSGFNPISSTLQEEVNSGRKAGTQVSGNVRSDKESEDEVNEFRESIFVSGTLGAINYVIRGMKDMPGRKSIMLLSGGFKLLTRHENGSADASRVLDSVKRLTDFANRSSVVIYTIDARGVTFDGVTAADDTSGLTDGRFESRVEDRTNEALDTQDGLRYLAQETGGLAYFLNGIGHGIRRALDDQNYYLVAYEPDAETFDPKKNRFNKIEVKVKRPGAKVRYRSGFFGFTDEQVAHTTAKSPNDAIYNALTSPFGINDISLRLNALFLADKKRSGYLRAFLHIGAKDLTFVHDANGKYRTTFDLIASTFGDNGVLQDGLRSTYKVELNDETYQKLMSSGVVYNFEFRLKKPGAYQMRVAIRDNATNRVGSANQFIDAPDLKKKRLTLSGIMLQNMEFADWKRFESLTPAEAMKLVNPLADTAIRRFQPGSVLTYSSDVYNAVGDASGKLNLITQAKIFSDQDLVFEGKAVPKEYTVDPAAEITAIGTMRLAANLAAGNYTLQMIVTDNNAPEGHRITSQFVPFEIVK